MKELVSFVFPLFCAGMLHEGGHFLMLCLFHCRLPKLHLTPLGAVMTTLPFSSYREALLVFAAGPAVNLLTVLLCRLFGVAHALSAASLFLGLLNLLPAEGMDGGEILRAALSSLGFPGFAEILLAVTGWFLWSGLFLLSLLLLLAGSANLTPFFLSFWMLFRLLRR